MSGEWEGRPNSGGIALTERSEQLRAKYRARFLDTASSKVDRGRALAAGGVENASDLEDAFRVIAGEASMLGLDGLAAVARAGEDAARLWREQSSSAAARICWQSLDTIDVTLDTLAGMNTGDFTREATGIVASRLSETPQALVAKSE